MPLAGPAMSSGTSREQLRAADAHERLEPLRCLGRLAEVDGCRYARRRHPGERVRRLEPAVVGELRERLEERLLVGSKVLLHRSHPAVRRDQLLKPGGVERRVGRSEHDARSDLDGRQ